MGLALLLALCTAGTYSPAVVYANDPTFPNSRRLVAGNGTLVDLATAGQVAR
jgi:hypothetical protein